MTTPPRQPTATNIVDMPRWANAAAVRCAVLALVSGGLLGAIAGCRSTATPAPPPTGTQPPAAGRPVLEHFPLAGGAFELALSPRGRDTWVFEAGWLPANGVAAWAELPIAAGSGRAQRDPVDLTWGADPGRAAWAVGEEEGYVGVAAQPLRFADGTVGLLVTQRFGFDHLKRFHALFVPIGGRLVPTWEYREPPGGTWSATTVLPETGPQREIILSVGRFGTEPDSADHLSLRRLIWDPDKTTLRPARAGDPAGSAVALVVGDFASAAEARGQRATAPPALQSLWVLASDSVPTLEPGRAVLGMVFAQRAQAEQARRRIVESGVAPPICLVEMALPSEP